MSHPKALPYGASARLFVEVSEMHDCDVKWRDVIHRALNVVNSSQDSLILLFVFSAAANASIDQLNALAPRNGKVLRK
jgi:hypothetical protein